MTGIRHKAFDFPQTTLGTHQAPMPAEFDETPIYAGRFPGTEPVPRTFDLAADLNTRLKAARGGLHFALAYLEGVEAPGSDVARDFLRQVLETVGD